MNARRNDGQTADLARLERSARFWMRAYPRRWRVFYGDDLVGVLADVAEPGARRVPTREAAGIVRAGWALRLRERPPFWKWFRYRMLGTRLPDRYRSWVIDDLLGKLLPQRIMLPFLGIWMSLTQAIPGLRVPASLIPGMAVFWLLVLVIGIPIRRFRASNDWLKFIGPEVPIELRLWGERRRAKRTSPGTR